MVGAISAVDLAGAIKFLQDWAALIVAAGALLAIVAGKNSLAAMGRWRDAVVGAVFYPIMAGVRAEKLAQAILVELKTNGGTSLKDAVNRIEERQVRQDGRFNLLLAMDDADAMFETDRNGLFTWVSPAHQRLTGRPIEEVLGWGWIAAVHDDDIDHVRQNWKAAVDEQRGFSMRFRIVRLGGDVVSVHATANTLKAGLVVIGWAGTVTEGVSA